MIKIIPAQNRYFANHGWLQTHHLFSFAEYYDPNNVHFGPLAVFNDDLIDGNSGFPMHPHKDMEIVTILLEGELTHEDSMGHQETIHTGEVQRMSAGTGVFHSEMNLGSNPVHLYQIWIYPEKENLRPEYETKLFNLAKNSLTLLAGKEGGMKINSKSSIYRGVFSSGNILDFSPANGKTFLYITKGKVGLLNHLLQKNDQARVDGESKIQLVFKEETDFILIDLPV